MGESIFAAQTKTALGALACGIISLALASCSGGCPLGNFSGMNECDDLIRDVCNNFPDPVDGGFSTTSNAVCGAALLRGCTSKQDFQALLAYNGCLPSSPVCSSACLLDAGGSAQCTAAMLAEVSWLIDAGATPPNCIPAAINTCTTLGFEAAVASFAEPNPCENELQGVCAAPRDVVSLEDFLACSDGGLGSAACAFGCLADSGATPACSAALAVEIDDRIHFGNSPFDAGPPICGP